TIVNDDGSGSGNGQSANARFASTAAAPAASGIVDLKAALRSGAMPSPNVPAAPSAIAPRRALAVDQVFASLDGQAQQIRTDQTVGPSHATDPWAELFANHDWLWNERVPGDIVF